MPRETRILVVDDCVSDAALAAFVLRTRLPSCHIDVVSDAAAFALAMAGGPDAVVTEHALSWSDGPQILRVAKRLRADCRVVLFTAAGADHAVSRALEDGLDGYVVKGSAGYVRLADVVGRALGIEATSDVRRNPAPGGNGKDRAEARDGRDAEQEVIRALSGRAALLARSNRELQQFAYVVSHDLQEPLNLTSRFARLLARRAADQLDPQAGRFLEHIVANTRRMQKMIDHVLEYSRIDSRGKPFEPVDIGVVVQQAIEDLTVAIERSKAEVTVGRMPTIVADERQLGQVFQNLIGNALKFRGDRAPRVTIGARETSEGWVLSVADNGIGIDPEHHERIFEMFQRLHTEAEIPGTGIGLAICSRIAMRHEGRIWVESEPDVGSTFHLLIPRGLAERRDESTETAGAGWSATH